MGLVLELKRERHGALYAVFAAVLSGKMIFLSNGVPERTLPPTERYPHL